MTTVEERRITIGRWVLGVIAFAVLAVSLGLAVWGMLEGN